MEDTGVEEIDCLTKYCCMGYNADVNQELERHIGKDTQISLVETQMTSWR